MTDYEKLREGIARKLSAMQMGLSNDGERLPDELWKQREPHATAILSHVLRTLQEPSEAMVEKADAEYWEYEGAWIEAMRASLTTAINASALNPEQPK